MNLFRLLVLGLLVWLVLRVLKSWRVDVSPRQQPPGDPRRRASGEIYEPMAQCAQCGVHLPRRALAHDGRCGACERG